MAATASFNVAGVGVTLTLTLLCSLSPVSHWVSGLSQLTVAPITCRCPRCHRCGKSEINRVTRRAYSRSRSHNG